MANTNINLRRLCQCLNQLNELALKFAVLPNGICIRTYTILKIFNVLASSLQ